MWLALGSSRFAGLRESVDGWLSCESRELGVESIGDRPGFGGGLAVARWRNLDLTVTEEGLPQRSGAGRVGRARSGTCPTWSRSASPVTGARSSAAQAPFA